MSETLKAYYDDVGSFKLLTKQQEKTLAQKIEKGDNQARDLMISSNLRLALSIANNFRKEYEEEFNEMPSNSEVADYLGIKESQVEDLRTGMQWPINIDSPVGGIEGGRTYADMIEDEDSPDIDMEIDAKKMMSLIREAFSSLKPQEEQVLRLRFGITEDDNNPQYKVS